MAPKAKVSNVKEAKVVKASVRVKLEEISVAEKSGWRQKDEIRIAELFGDFRSGRYGWLTFKQLSCFINLSAHAAVSGHGHFAGSALHQ